MGSSVDATTGNDDSPLLVTDSEQDLKPNETVSGKENRENEDSLVDLNWIVENDPNLAAFSQYCPKSFTHSSEIPRYDWTLLYETFDYVQSLYIDEMASIMKEFDGLDIRRSIWSESAFRLDISKSKKKFRTSEEWLSNQEDYLTCIRNDLFSSVNIIKETLDRMNDE